MSGPQIFTPEHGRRIRALESDGWWSATMRDVAVMLLRDARLPERCLMVDIGCGSGQTGAWFNGSIGIERSSSTKLTRMSCANSARSTHCSSVS
jgi:hypothetical protein